MDLVIDLETGNTESRPVDPADIHPIALDDFKQLMKLEVDQAAGRARSRYISVGPGQEATYMMKAAEADAYVAAGYPADTSGYPILTAEAQARGITVSAMANLIRATRDQWAAVAAAVEAIRIGSKLAIDAAGNIGEARSVRDSAVSQFDSL
jgi:hypothetical protein